MADPTIVSELDDQEMIVSNTNDQYMLLVDSNSLVGRIGTSGPAQKVTVIAPLYLAAGQGLTIDGVAVTSPAAALLAAVQAAIAAAQAQVQSLRQRSGLS